MFKKVLLTSILTIVATTTFAMADGDKKVTSKNYVDTAVATKQEKITAGTTGNVVTYNGTTNGQAQFSERGIYGTGTAGDANDVYDETTDGDKLVTASVVRNIYGSLRQGNQFVSNLECTQHVDNDPSKDCLLYSVNYVSGVLQGCRTDNDCGWLDCGDVSAMCYYGMCICTDK